MSKRIFAVLAALLICALSGCSLPAGSSKVDYGYVEGYYSELSYEVKNDAGEVTEQMYLLHTDSEHADVIGKKDVYFNADGELSKYTVTIGTETIEKIISYTCGEGSSFYSEMCFDEDQRLYKSVWENNYSDPDGVKIRELGEQEYYPDGKTVKSYRQELYRDGELSETVTRNYDENGGMISEAIE